jgi:hypothetical protein
MNFTSRTVLPVWVLCSAALSTSCASTPTAPPATNAAVAAASTPRNGATRPATNTAGFEAWLESEARWVDADAFLAADKASRPANRFPDADVFPPYAETKEHDGMLLLTPDGPCEMYFFHTRWRRRADVRAWGKELRSYKACGTVFSRKIGFAAP